MFISNFGVPSLTKQKYSRDLSKQWGDLKCRMRKVIWEGT